jgi:hypothetical protein
LHSELHWGTHAQQFVWVLQIDLRKSFQVIIAVT